MDDRFIGKILPGQSVRDMNGDKVGSVARVYREDVSVSQPRCDDVVEVKTGLFGLGGRLYVPVSAIDDATDTALFVGKPADAFEQAWHEKPDYLEQLQ